jgi:ABC-type branched-subunit amino acid transport system substrate-binding protein
VQDTLLVAYDTTDFTPPLTEVMDSGADFVILVWAGASGVTLIKQAFDLGVFDKMGLIQGTDTNYHVALGNLAIQDTVAYIVYHYTLPDNEINDWMVEQHMRATSRPKPIRRFIPPTGKGVRCRGCSPNAVSRPPRRSCWRWKPPAAIPILAS